MKYHRNNLRQIPISNKQYQKLTESFNNSGLTKLGINSLLKSENEFQIKKVNLIELIEESLKQINEYRFKIQTNLIEQLSTKTSNEIKVNNLFKFPSRPNLPIELTGKSNKNHLIPNSNLTKSDETNTLIGRYEITNSMIPITNFFHSNEQINKFNLNISFEYFEEYYKYFNRLLEEYFNENVESKLNILSLTEQIKDFFKNISQRYKIIVQIYIQQHLNQSIFIASRSLWDKTNDQVLQYKFFKRNIFIIIVAFFIYKE